MKSLKKLILLALLLLNIITVNAQSTEQSITKTFKAFDWLDIPVVDNQYVRGGHHFVPGGTTVDTYIQANQSRIEVGTLITLGEEAGTSQAVTYRVTAFTAGTPATYTLEEIAKVTTWQEEITYNAGQTVLCENRLYLATTTHTSTDPLGLNPAPAIVIAGAHDFSNNITDWRPTGTKIYPSTVALVVANLTDGTIADALPGDIAIVADNGLGESEMYLCIFSDYNTPANNQWYGSKSGEATGSLPIMKHFTVADNLEITVIAALNVSGGTTIPLNLTAGSALTVDIINVVAIPFSWRTKDFYIGTSVAGNPIQDRLFDNGLIKYVASIDHDGDGNTPNVPYQFWVLDFIIPTGNTVSIDVR
jgi:hypothetical protein